MIFSENRCPLFGIMLCGYATFLNSCCQRRTHAAELDRLETHAKRRLGGMMAFDIVLRMNALVGADRHAARRGDARHAGEIVGMDRLLEKAQAAIGNRTHVTDTFL